jgi:hypothetical protein
MENKLTTIDKFLETFSGKGIDSFDAHQAVAVIKTACSKIPADGEYDPAIIGKRIGEYVHAIMECGKLLASLGMAEKFQETEVEKAQAIAALERAPQKGYTTAQDKKFYAQMDEDYLREKQKLVEIQGAITYIENYRTSLDKAHLHCKKIIDRSFTEERFANDHERYSASESRKEISWVNDDDLK